MKKTLFAALLMLLHLSGLKAQDNNTYILNNKAVYSRFYDYAPRFPDKYTGGFFEYLTQNIQYPKNVTADVSGQISIRAVIDTTGKIGDLKIVRSISPEVDQEVINTIGRSPNWQPAMYRGKTVPAFLSIVLNISVNAQQGTITAKRDAQQQIKEMQIAKRTYDVKPKFAYAGNNFVKYIADNIQFPKDVKSDIHGYINVNYDIDTTGAITNIGIAKNISKEVDQAVLDVLAKAPNHTPGLLNGKKVVVRLYVALDIDVKTAMQTITVTSHPVALPPPPYSNTQSAVRNSDVPVKANYSDDIKGLQALATGNNTDEIYAAVEIAPGYPGGETAFAAYLKNNIHYPAYARQNRVQGRGYVQFVVEKNGELSNVKTVRTPSLDLAEEAMRVIKKSGRWTPGLQNNIPVRVQFTVPINFSL